MDATEVIVLDDSSASESETAHASASTTPSTSPVPWRPAQSVGYANAVEAALAMAAAFDTTSSTRQPKEKKAAPAPPLLPTKSQKTKQVNKVPQTKPKKKKIQRRKEKHRPRSSSISSLDSDSSSSLSSGSRGRPRYGAIGTDRPRPSAAPRKGSTQRQSSPSRTSKQQLERQRPTNSQQLVEVVDLLSCRSSVSSLTSSDSESLTRTPVKKKKKLVLNDRALERSKPHSSFAGQSTERVDPTRPRVAVNVGKRKRVLPQMRRESSNVVKKRVRPPEGQLRKKKLKKKKPAESGVDHTPRPRNVGQKSAQSTQNELISLSSSSSSALSSPAPSPPSSPRPLPSRKSVAAAPTAIPPVNQGREGETDAFGRYHCRKSASSRVKTPSRKVSSALPSSASTNSMSSPSPSPRKKRRVFSYFNTDQVSLDDLQAQERELAWIQKQRKQTQNRSGFVKPANQKQKACREVICVDDHSDANSVANSEDHHRRKDHAKVKVKVAATVTPRPPVISRNALLHPTAYRGVFFDEAPPNILVQTGVACSEPFESDCNVPLTFYDETDTLGSYCSILETFGKPNQCISSVFPSEISKPQSDVTRSVSSLVMAHLPIIRRCQRRKVQATLSEARLKISAYQAALKKHKMHNRYRYVTTPRLFFRSTTEKQTAKQLKTTQHTCSIDDQSVSFQIGRGDGFIREKTLSSLIQINRVEKVQSLRKYTTSIGLRANYRVDDDPILRYTTTTRPNGTDDTNGAIELAKKYGLRHGNVADDEVAEYVLRLVVGRLSDTEQVFHALKSELGFSQAYTAYSELKKLHDSRERASVRLNRMENLCRNEDRAQDPDVAAIVNLMEQSSLSTASRAKVLRKRLQPPIRNLESSMVDSLVENTTLSMSTLGLRATESYKELVDVYGGSLCRMCYMYACHEHRGDHPLPARRVDPIYPHVQLMARVAQSGAYTGNPSTPGSDEDVGYLGIEVNDAAATGAHDGMHQSSSKELINLESDAEMSDGSSVPRQPRHSPTADPSEYVDASHVSMVAARMHSFLSPANVCGKLCWKNVGSTDKSDHRSKLSTAELGVIRKLRETMGDNSCLLAAMIASASCIELHELIVKDLSNNETRDCGGRSRRVRNWKHGRRSGGSNHELLQRTRNQRLQDRGTENHEYEPCVHEGMCDSTGCSCMKRDHMCEKACACSRDCPNRFEGCSCSPGECRTNKCPCFAALRECDPDVCVACGASDLAVAVSLATNSATKGNCAGSTCGNVNVIRSKHKLLGKSFSSIHGYGMYTQEPIAANEFVYEYTGAMVSQDEAERRGLMYDKMEMSYLFDLNEDAVLDALRNGNKSKFINHEGETPNCTAKVVSVCGVHHITIWALRDIAVGEELVFDYGYKRSTGASVEQHRRIPDKVFPEHHKYTDAPSTISFEETY
ncbi:hypothetical protein PHMEG_0002089 [Phytophthora megakarya]|uniref:Polycomb-like protein n=1 Tax=Phytophthora megakarya TaxID=4795 RepID=A0A225X192_9STRA|nr:hypothetical protein PHMEG_0002089 [Phytophthora megakarya]